MRAIVRKGEQQCEEENNKAKRRAVAQRRVECEERRVVAQRRVECEERRAVAQRRVECEERRAERKEREKGKTWA